MNDRISSISERYPEKLHDVPSLRDRIGVFENRNVAGKAVAELIDGSLQDDSIVLAIPAGGIPVASSLAECLNLPLDVAVVSKITLPWNTEVGCGAVAFDGSVDLNEDMLRRVGLTGEELSEQIEHTRDKVQRREQLLRKNRVALNVSGKTVVLVDDGLASGFTMQLAVTAIRQQNPRRVTVAVPTAPLSTIEDLIDHVDQIWCANIRTGPRFAVAEAYLNWYDVSETEAANLLK